MAQGIEDHPGGEGQTDAFDVIKMTDEEYVLGLVIINVVATLFL